MQAKKIIDYYDSLEYHVQARNRALKVGTRRLNKIQRVLDGSCDAILEVGCGVGVYSDNLNNWVGLDISKIALNANKAKGVVQASALNLPFKNDCFSLVMMFEAIEHLPNPEQSLIEIIRVLKPGGLLAIGSPPLVWEVLLTGELSNTKRKRIPELDRIVNVTMAGWSKPFIMAFVRHLGLILTELIFRLRDETIIALGSRLRLRSIYLEPDYTQIGEDYDATYAYNPNAVVNFLRSRFFKIVDLRSFPSRIYRLPTIDVEIIIARKNLN
jgi:SAM-dependent methyltransferase